MAVRVLIASILESSLKCLAFGYSGLLVGACVNRAPEGLLGAAVAEVGVLDLLKVCLINSSFVC